MVLRFLGDRSLQICALVIVMLSGPIESEYVADLESMQQGPAAQASWAARRAAGTKHWWQTSQNILSLTHSHKVLQRLRITMKPQGAPAVSPDAPWIQQELKSLNLLVDFGHELISRYIWAHIPFMCNVPENLAVFLLEGKDQERAVRFVQSLLEAVYAAEIHWKALSSTNVSKASLLEKVFNQMGWLHHQLAREVLARLIQENFSVTSRDILVMCRMLFEASTTTKHVLEDVFAHLHKMCSRSSTNKKMSDFARWLYATTARSVASGGMPGIFPDARDWRDNQRGARQGVFRMRQLFDMNATQLPEPRGSESALLPKPAGLRKLQWKAAGPESQQKGAAAALYLQEDLHTQWSRVDKVWAGPSHAHHSSTFTLSCSRFCLTPRV